MDQNFSISSDPRPGGSIDRRVRALRSRGAGCGRHPPGSVPRRLNKSPFEPITAEPIVFERIVMSTTAHAAGFGFVERLARDLRDERLELPALAAEIERNGRRARLLPDADSIVETIAPEMRSGDVVAILSNGGFGGIYEKLPARLRQLTNTNEVSNRRT